MKLISVADHTEIVTDGKDLSLITDHVMDKDGLVVTRSNNRIAFTIKGLGEIVAARNGDPTNLVFFSSNKRDAFAVCTFRMSGQNHVRRGKLQ